MDILATGRKQPDLWSRYNAPISYVKPLILGRTSTFNGRQSLLPWRPNVEYKISETLPLIKQSTHNAYALNTQNTINSLKYPNLVREYEYNPVHASKTTLYTRFTPNEWLQKEIKYYNEADSCRHFSERIRNDAFQIIRDAEEKIQSGQYCTNKKLGEKINDTNFWRNEIVSELERLFQEIERLQDCYLSLEKAIKDIDHPLHITEECLYYREARKEIELVHDEPEKCLLNEKEMLVRNKSKLETCLDKCRNQIQNCRASQCCLELDLKNKENALGIDTMCHQLNNYSHGLQYYFGIENYQSCFSEPDELINATNQAIETSQIERNKSCQLRTNAEALINKIAHEIWNAWNSTNNALAHRSSELLEAKNKLQQHLQMVQQEIFDVEKSLELMHKAIADKGYPLKVAQTRLQARMHRLDLELCRDYAHTSIQKEIVEVNHQVERMFKTLKDLENQHQKLLRTQTMLEHDLTLKIDAIYIDQEKVCGLRRAYPINVFLKF
ncbi:unnamed protein product [Xylocopa violacea]|uniref:Tektin n=1 Tax=Xylocopa violacea TaxID=135666 RepID=A0ABP1MZX8_XYLVO